jgi:hypothetical protein
VPFIIVVATAFLSRLHRCCHCAVYLYVSVVAMTSITIIAVVFPSLHLSPLLSRCPSPSRHRRLAVVPSIFIVAVVLLSHHPSLSITVAIASPSRCSVAVVAAHHRPLLLIPSLIGCCVVFQCPLSSSHAVMRLSMLLMLAAFAANRRPPPPLPPPPQLPLPPGRHHRHRHHRGRTHRRTLTKKEAAAAPLPAY